MISIKPGIDGVFFVHDGDAKHTCLTHQQAIQLRSELLADRCVYQEDSIEYDSLEGFDNSMIVHSHLS